MLWSRCCQPLRRAWASPTLRACANPEVYTVLCARLSSLAAQNEAVPQPEPAAQGGPEALFTAGVQQGKYRADPQQLVAVRKLQRLWEELQAECGRAGPGSGLTLVDAVEETSSWTLWELVRSRRDETTERSRAIRGLYLYGGVGSGKTMLMDVFYGALPLSVRKKRIHFHDFMLDVHRNLRDLKHVADPLREVASRFTRGGRAVLCLDELMVTDVADAMILRRLFQHLFDFGLVLVSTSNRAPERLYEHGLQRPLFLPFIALLRERCEVHDIQGTRDYRLLARRLAQPLYFSGPSASSELQQCLDMFAHGVTPGPVTLSVAMGRTIHVARSAEKVAYLTFSEACEQPVAAADYAALCDRFHTLLIDGVPVFDAATRAAAHRLVTLVDVAYERRVRLILAAHAPSPEGLFTRIVTQADYRVAQHTQGEELVVDDVVGFAKERTVSRLIEMSSLHYAREHAARHAPELLPSLPPEESQLV